MNDPITEFLSTYLDGELSGQRLRLVEDHLASCAACRKELDELRLLSGLLQQTIPSQAFTPTERFAANLALELPRRPDAAPARNFSQAAWWLIPADAVIIWIILQTVTTVTTLFSAAGAAGLIGSTLPWLQNSAQQSLWATAIINLFGNNLSGSGRDLLTFLNNVSVVSTGFTMQLAWQAGIGLLILGWLAVWLPGRGSSGQARLPESSSHS